MKKFILFLVSVITLSASSQKTYLLDKNHARLSFSIAHFGISHVEGHFRNFDVTLISTKDDLSDAKIEMTADVKTIDTDNDKRDEDLRGANWFDAEKYPQIVFKSTSFKKTGGNKYLLTGELTIHGVTKTITLDATLNGKSTNPMNKKTSLGFTVTGKLDRTEFGVGSSSGSPVGKEAEIKANIEFTLE
jgi:polyisoprenoid-binding protein YceI